MKIKNLFKAAAALMAVLLAVSVLAVCSFAADDPTIAVGTVEAVPGEEVAVPISLVNNPGIMSLMFDVTYADGLTLTAINHKGEDGKILFDTANGDVSWYTETSEASLSKNPKTLSWGADTMEGNIEVNGPIVYLTFKVPADAEVGHNYEISVSYEKDNDCILANDENNETHEVEFATTAGGITVIECHHANPTWTTNDENTEHWQVCENGHVLEETKGAHKGGTATCEKLAVCEVCGKEYGELAAHTLTKVDAKAATETEAGNIEYYKCSVCGKLFSDAEGKTEITADQTVIAALGHTHKLTKVEAKAATATEDGNIEYYKCEGCGKIFKDAEGKEEISLADTVIPKTGKPGSPQTGDTSMLVVMSVSMVLAAAAVATAVVLKKKVND